MLMIHSCFTLLPPLYAQAPFKCWPAWAPCTLYAAHGHMKIRKWRLIVLYPDPTPEIAFDIYSQDEAQRLCDAADGGYVSDSDDEDIFKVEVSIIYVWLCHLIWLQTIKHCNLCCYIYRMRKLSVMLLTEKMCLLWDNLLPDVLMSTANHIKSVE